MNSNRLNRLKRIATGVALFGASSLTACRAHEPGTTPEVTQAEPDAGPAEDARPNPMRLNAPRPRPEPEDAGPAEDARPNPMRLNAPRPRPAPDGGN